MVLVIERVRYTPDLRRVEDNLTERVCVGDVDVPVGCTRYKASRLNVRGDPTVKSPELSVFVPDEVPQHLYARH